ncbi:MAG: hypothetical protein JO354_07145 [Verrucomicrobia bacterium]|nr:hypothetical protein [Verrucomicrobiota bacterium]
MTCPRSPCFLVTRLGAVLFWIDAWCIASVIHKPSEFDLRLVHSSAQLSLASGRVTVGPHMISPFAQTTDRLTLLQRGDHFRVWNSLEDKRVCVLCDATFDGRDVLVTLNRGELELHCPTRGCRSGVHQWVYPGNPLIDETANADWWCALGQPGRNHIPAV